MALPVRKHPRLKNYDYGQCGCYHITICVKHRRPILSKITCPSKAIERAAIQLTQLGRIVQRFILNIPDIYHDVRVDKYVIMPNHVHLLLTLGAECATTIPTIVRSLKRMITRESGESIWQESYYDVVIRNDSMFQCEWDYIENNPDKWAEDELYIANM